MPPAIFRVPKPKKHFQQELGTKTLSYQNFVCFSESNGRRACIFGFHILSSEQLILRYCVSVAISHNNYFAYVVKS